MTTFLLDTHVVIWALNEPARLRPEVADLLVRPQHQLLISVASFWETAVKVSTGRLIAPDDFPSAAVRLGLDILPITPKHAWAVRELSPLHGDPFDRLLVAQALADELTLVTHDTQLLAYGCKTLLT